MNRQLKQVLTIILAVTMIFSLIAPVFVGAVESPAGASSQQEIETTQQTTNNTNNKDARINDKTGTESKDSVTSTQIKEKEEKTEAVQEQQCAMMEVNPETATVYPVLLGNGFSEGRFNQVEWAGYIDSNKDESHKFYDEYLSLKNNNESDEAKSKKMESLKAFVEKQVATEQQSPAANIQEPLPFGLYYVVSEGYEAELVELTGVGECKIALNKEQTTTEQPKKDNPDQQETQKARVKKAPSLRGSSTLQFNEEDIEKFTAEFVRGATIQRDGSVLWEPINSNADHRLVYKVTYAFSGVGEIAAGDVEIHVPKMIIKDRDGEYADYYDIAIPSLEEYEKEGDETTKWVYKESEENNNELIVYNIKEISAAEAGTIEVSYLTEKRTFYYKDMSTTDDFNAHLVVKNENTEITADADAPPVTINTFANITSTKKQNPIFYKRWAAKFGPKPENADDYYYILWTVRTQVNKDNTQPYVLSYEDNFDGGDVVGYRFEGQQEYSTNNSVTVSHQSSYERYDYVLTRHSKTEYAGKDYTLWNRIVATVHPADEIDEDTTANSKAPFEYSMPVYKRPPGSFYTEKFGQYLNVYSTSTDENGEGIVRDSEDISDFSLAEFKAGEIDVIDNPKLKYYSFLRGYPYPWTVAKGKSLDEPENYGEKPVTFVYSDENLHIGENTNLGPGDYEITNLRMTYEFSDAVFDEEELKFVETTADLSSFTDDMDLILYAKKATDEDWVNIAKYSFSRGGYYDINGSYITKCAGKDITFSPGVLGYKWEVTNKLYYTRINTYPTIKLFRTEKVLNDMGNQRRVPLTNTAFIRVYDYEGNELFPNNSNNSSDQSFKDKGISGTDYLAGVIRESYIQKKHVGKNASKAKKTYTISWKIDMNESYEDNDGRHFKLQESGRFYDLCPVGSHPNLKSIEVYKDNYVKLSDNDYSVDLITNWKDTGRDMVIININVPAKKYSFNIDTIHEWEDIKDTSFTVLNPVAYETGNNNIAEGYPDNGGNSLEKNLMTDLDPDTDAVKFIYSSDRDYIDLITATSTGLNKKVKEKNDEKYSYSTFTTINGEYYYRIRLQNDTGTRTKGIIFYDSLENYANEDVSSDWHGTLQGVDVAVLRNAGIDAVVYYSAIPNLDIYAHNDLNEEINGEKVWKTGQEFGDITQAKAVAIDCRKTIAGEDYYLNNGDSIQARLIMKAPPSDVNIGRIRYAYNNVFMHEIEVNDQNEEHEDLIRHDYTKIGYKISGSTEFLKVRDSNHNEKIEGIRFSLVGTSAYGKNVEEIYTSDKDGKVSIKNLEMGTYELRELYSNDDWLVDKEVYHITIDGTGKATIDLPRENNQYYWENTPRVHGNVSLMKQTIQTRDGIATIPNTEFTLVGTSDYGTEISIKGVTDADGKLTFENIEKGTYSLMETKEVPDYLPNNTVYTVRINDSGLGSIDGCKQNATSFIIENIPRYHSFDIRKVDSVNENMRLSGAVFALTGTSNIGTQYENLEATTNDRGVASFTNIEAGKYILKETKAPDKHVLDTASHEVEIKDNGEIIISGLETEDGSLFVWKNDRTQDGKIKITKIWEDGFNNDERPIPKVHLMTSESYFDDTEAYAEYDTNSGVLRFFRDTKNKYSNLQQIGSKLYFCNIEDGNNGWIDVDRVTSIRKVIFEDVIRPKVLNKWFSGDKMKFSKIDFRNVDTSYLTYMEKTFENNKYVSSVEFGDHFDTKRVTNMAYLFSNCTNLRSIDMSGMDVSAVSSANDMFYKCSNLKEANLHGLKFGGQRSAGYEMFRDCISLEKADLSDARLTYAMYTFQNCHSLEEVDLSNSTLVNMDSTFEDCENLKKVNLKNAKIVDRMRNTFSTRNTESIGSPDSPLHINTQGTDWTDVTGVSYIFFGKVYLDSLYIKDLGVNSDTFNFYDPFVGVRVTKPDAPIILDGVRFRSDYEIRDCLSRNFYSSTSLKDTNMATFIVANTKLIGTSWYETFYDNVIFSNVDVETTSLYEFGHSFKGAVLDFRGLKNTNRLTNIQKVAYNAYCNPGVNAAITNYDKQWIIFGDDFDTTNVPSYYYIGYQESGSASDSPSGLQTHFYLGSNNFKLDNLEGNKPYVFHGMGRSYPAIIYSDINEATINALDAFHGSTIQGPNGTLLNKFNGDDGYKYYKVDGGESSPGVFTPTSQADLPDHPDVVFERSVQEAVNEANQYFTNEPMFPHKESRTALGSEEEQEATLGNKITVQISNLSGAAFIYWKNNNKLSFIPLPMEPSENEVTYTIPVDSFYLSYGQQGNTESELKVKSITPITEGETVEYSVAQDVPLSSFGGSFDNAVNGTIHRTMASSEFLLVENRSVYTAEDMHITENSPKRTHILKYTNGNDMVTDNAKWVKEGNVWTYTFDVYDDEAMYYMYEEPLDGYTATYSGPINNNGIITKSGTINNRSSETGHLLLKKSVENGIPSDTDKKFEFTITLNANNPALLSGVQQYGDTVFVNGKATAQLSAADTEGLFLYDIPTYFTYTIKESVNPSFEATSRSGSITGDNTISGPIIANDIVTVNYTNTRTKSSNSSFTIQKEVVGTTDNETAFDFNVLIQGLEPNSSYKYKIGSVEGTYESTQIGTASLNIQLKHNQSCDFINLPESATYKVNELANKYVSSYEISTEDDTEINNPRGANVATLTDLSTETESVGTKVLFKNTLPKEEGETANIKLIKKDSSTGKELAGAVYRLSGTADDGSEINVSKTSDSTGEFMFKDIPDGKYVLQEETAPDGFALDPTIRDVKVVNGHPMHYSQGEMGTAVSHTPNISDDGTQNGNYPNSAKLNDVITIPGSRQLTVQITYGGESKSYDWACVWEGNHPNYTAASNYSSSISGKLGGGKHTDASNTKTYEINGDTVTFGFKSDSSGVGDGYGYYAVVTGLDGDYDMHELSIEGLQADNRGYFTVSDTPATLGEFTIEKVSAVNPDDKLASAEFTLYDSENKVVTRKNTDNKGLAEFTNLATGTYTLKETGAPMGYIRTEKVYTVTVNENHDVTISDENASALTPTDGKYRIENPPRPMDFKISKIVSGNFGNRNTSFNFSIAISNAVPDTEYVIRKTDGTTATFRTDSDGAATPNVSLKHDEEATIEDLPYNSHVTATEPATKYTSEYTVYEGSKVVDQKTSPHANMELTTKEIVLDANQKVVFKNTLNGIVPTGVAQTQKTLIILFITVLVSFIMFKRKERIMAYVSRLKNSGSTNEHNE